MKFLFLLLLAPCILWQSAEGEQGARPISKLFKYSLSKRAATFGKFTPYDRNCYEFWSGKSGKEGLKEDCCGGGGGGYCYYEERSEYAEMCEWETTSQFLCELSIKEKYSCTCQPRSGSDYECSSQTFTDECICETGYAYCGTERKCYNKNYKCDSDNDCGNWKDEEGCTIAAGQEISLEGGISGVNGNVMVGDRPVCDHRWDDNAAKVVCKKVKSSDNIKALATSNSYFGSVSSKFRMSNVQCQGTENDISECSHTTIYQCSSNEGAGVHCIDPTSLKLVTASRDKQKNNGFVSLNNYLFCADSWNSYASQIVCNQLYKDKEGIERVYVFQEGGFYPPGNELVVDGLGCTGTEKYLTECPNFSIDGSCNSKLVVQVQCAKCFSRDFVKILKKVQMTHNIEDLHDEVAGALYELSETCYDWDCSNPELSDPLYCKTKKALEGVNLILENRKKQFALSNDFNELEKLNHDFVKSEFDSLKNLLNGLTEKFSNFQNKLSDYFKESAKFREKRLVSEIAELRSSLEDDKAGRDKEEEKYKLLVKELVEAVNLQAVGSIFMNIIKYACHVAEAMEDPLKLFDVVDDLGGIISAGSKMANAQFLSDLLPKFAETTKGIADRMKENQNDFVLLNELLNEKGKMDPEKAKKYVTLTIKSPYTTTDLADIQFFLEGIVGGLCDLLQSYSLVAEKCKNGKFHAQRVIAYHKALQDTYLDMANYVKEIAKSKLQISLAEDISVTLQKDLGNKQNVEIAKIQSIVLLRLRKFQLIEGACKKIKYMRYNEELDVCRTLKENMDSDLGDLLSYEITKNMCDRGTNYHKYNNLPVSFKNSDGFKIDVKNLFNGPNREEEFYFQIPDNDWLVKNDWIDEYTSKLGPFVLKGMQVILPPIFTEENLEVTTTVTLVNNTMSNEVFNFDERPLARSVVSMNADCSENEIDNPYDIYGCPKNDPICLTARGEFQGPVYPSLQSLYKIAIRVEHPTNVKISIPKTKIYLKARVDICFDGKNRHFGPKIEKPMNSAICCPEKGYYYHSIENVLAGKPACQECPPNSVPILHGYCCA